MVWSSCSIRRYFAVVLLFWSIYLKTTSVLGFFVRCAQIFNQLLVCVFSFTDNVIPSKPSDCLPISWIWCQVGTSLVTGGDLLIIFTLDLQLRFVLAVTGNLISIKMSTSVILISARCNFVNCIILTAAAKFYLSAN